MVVYNDQCEITSGRQRDGTKFSPQMIIFNIILLNVEASVCNNWRRKRNSAAR